MASVKPERELWRSARKQKEEKSINLYRFTVTAETLTFVRRVAGPLDRTATPRDTGVCVCGEVILRGHLSPRLRGKSTEKVESHKHVSVSLRIKTHRAVSMFPLSFLSTRLKFAASFEDSLRYDLASH